MYSSLRYFIRSDGHYISVIYINHLDASNIHLLLVSIWFNASGSIFIIWFTLTLSSSLLLGSFGFQTNCDTLISSITLYNPDGSQFIQLFDIDADVGSLR